MPKHNHPTDPEELRTLLHQLNNDLSLVLGYIDLAARAARNGPDQVTGRLVSAKDAARRMAASITQAQKAARSAAARVEQEN